MERHKSQARTLSISGVLTATRDPDLFCFIFDLDRNFKQAAEAIMRCPRCVQKIHRGAETCPHCGFGMLLADQEFSHHNPVVKCLSDRAGLMRRAERVRVQQSIEKFCARFPQLFFCVHTAVFADPSQLRAFGIWLLNRGIFEDVPQRANASGIVLVMDVERKAAGMSYGYHLEPYLDESDTFECLSRAHPHWLEGKHDHGIIVLLNTLTKILERTSRQAKSHPEKFAKKVVPSQKLSSIVDRIRQGARTSETQSEGEPEVEL